MTKRFLALALALATFGAGPAMAGPLNILVSGTHPGNQIGTIPTKIAIAGTGTSLTFKTTKPSTSIYVNFNAECAATVATAGSTGWVSALILIGGVPLPPTSTLQAMCTNSSSGPINYTTAEIQALGPIPAGTHTLEVQATASNTGIGWWLGDTSIIVAKF